MPASSAIRLQPHNGTSWSKPEQSSCLLRATGTGLRSTMSVPAATTGRLLRTAVATTRTTCTSTIRPSTRTTTADATVGVCALFVMLNKDKLQIKQQMCMARLQKANQKRPVSNKTGKARQAQISMAMEQYNRAMKDCYYIEAIALMESAISDRMESALNYLFPNKDYSYNTVGFLAKCLLDNQQFLNENWVAILEEIKQWSKQRNDAIHQMVKLMPDLSKSFQVRYKELKKCAKEGSKLFRMLDNEQRKTKRYQKKHPLIFTLKPQYNNKVKYPNELRIKCKVADLQKLKDHKVYDQIKVFEDENGGLWRKKLLDMYYDRVEKNLDYN